MATCQALADVLDETINALTVLDLESLQILEERASVLAQSGLLGDEVGTALLLAKKGLLERVLHGSLSNLNAFSRLYGRDTRDTWEH